jgi:transposase InsO family protein
MARQLAVRRAGCVAVRLPRLAQSSSSAREIHDAKLVMAIETSFKASDRTYGARRFSRDVLEEALACGLHRIERLTLINALRRARPKRRGCQCRLKSAPPSGRLLVEIWLTFYPGMGMAPSQGIVPHLPCLLSMRPARRLSFSQ